MASTDTSDAKLLYLLHDARLAVETLGVPPWTIDAAIRRVLQGKKTLQPTKATGLGRPTSTRRGKRADAL